jgi:hypothetical protein
VSDFWTPEREAYLVAHPTDFHGFNARYGPVERHVWRNKRNRLVGPQQEMHDGGSLAVTPPPSDEEWLDYMRNAEATAAKSLALTTTQQQTTWVAPQDGRPVGIAFTGDWHLGARGVDYAALDATLETIRDTPGLYAVGMGDYCEGVSVYDKARGSLYTGAYNDPHEQSKSVMLRAEMLYGKWLAFLAGNHDEMHARHTGLGRTPLIAEELRCPHFGEGGGTIFANVGSQRYAIGVRHHFGGKGANVPRRMMDEWPEWERLHVAVMAHLHFNEVQRVSRNGGRCWGLRCGTFKLHDAYADRHGFRPEMGTPVTILFPDTERVLAFAGDDFDLALSVLAAERLRYADNVIQSGRH